MATRQQPPAAADETAVRGLYEELMDGWNQGSGAAFAAVFTTGGDLVAFDGTHLRGRPEIADVHDRLFSKFMKGSRLIGHVESVRFLDADTAVMHAVGNTVMRGKSRPSRERASLQTLVAVREPDRWRVAAFQNTRVRPMGRNVGTALVWLLGDLLWRVFRLDTDTRPAVP